MRDVQLFLTSNWIKYLVILLVVSAGLAGGYVTGTHFYDNHQLHLADDAVEDLSRRLASTPLSFATEGINNLTSEPIIVETAAGKRAIDAPEALQVLQIGQFIFKSALIYILDTKGNVVACTPYGENGDKTLTGHNYHYRPYFSKALSSTSQKIYIALGVATQKRGIYISKQVTDNRNFVGVLVIKMGMDSIDQALEKTEYPCALYNNDGVIIASNQPEWVFKTFTPISTQRLTALHASKQFGSAPLTPLGFTLERRVMFMQGQNFYAADQATNIQGWRLVVFKPDTEGHQAQIWGFSLAGGMLISLVFATTISALERSKTKELLKEESKRLELALEGGKLGTWDWHIPSGTVTFDRRWAEMKGYSPSEIEHSLDFWESLVHPDDLPLVYKKLQAHFERQTEQYESVFRLRHQNGQWMWIMDRGKVVEWGANDQPLRACGTHLDITEQKALEQEIRKEHEKFFSILDTAPVGIVIIDPHKIIRWINEFALNFSGLPTKGDLLGQHCNQYLCPVANNECPALDLHQPVQSAEQIFRNHQGTISPIIKTIKEIEYEGESCLLEIFVDIAEQKKLEHELLQAQKLESVGRLAAGVAHEINTPVQYISTNIEFIAESFTQISHLLSTLTARSEANSTFDQEELKMLFEEHDIEFLLEELPASLHQSAEGVRTITSIVSAMKRFSHPGNTMKSPIDLNEIIETALLVSKSEWKHVATVKTELDPELPKIPLLSDEIGQVILNVVINAAHAIISAKEDNKNTAEGIISIKTQMKNDFAEVRIQDNGCGIPKENLPKIYDFFFTTKEVGKGTGQGLALSYDIITNKHNGQIHVESEVGVGTTFILNLPLNISSSPAT
nr:PAS domain-containing protein [uncultured Desulfobulbus sp.]